MSREKLPGRRFAATIAFKHTYPVANPREYTVTVGHYPDGRIGEVFIQLCDGKEKTVATDLHDATIILSLALQFGADLKAIGRSLLRGEDGAPHGFLGSLVDAVVAYEDGLKEAA